MMKLEHLYRATVLVKTVLDSGTLILNDFEVFVREHQELREAMAADAWRLGSSK